ncbi:MAG TPA: MFS transporter [Roseiflexaceae bacterium]|nr:MFS transporter [Roseiflexaceae bacterium]
MAANTISLIGSALTAIALPWFVLQTTGSAALTGLAGFFVMLPGFVAGIFGGTLVDRLGYKHASIIADVVSGVGVALIPFLYQTVGLAFWQLLALVFLGSLLGIPGTTARRALLPELADIAGTRLERVNGSFEAIQHLAYLLGPPLAGILIVWLGAGNVLWIDAATFAASAIIVALAIPSALVRVQAAATGRYLSALGEGFRFLKRDRLLLSIAVTLAITNFFGNTLLAVILPVYAKAAFGRATDLGVIIAASGAGMLVGATIFGAVGHRLPRRAAWLVAFMVVPVEFWVLTLSPPLWLIVTVLAISGVISGPIDPLLVTLRHERIPTQLRGRIFSTFSAIAQVGSPLGIVLAGVLIDGIGLQPTVLAIAICAQIVGVAMLFVPVFHEMNRPSASISV